MAVSLALEGKASHRELTSRLLSDLSGKMLSQADMARAFDKMLKELPDLLLDTPEAPQVSCSCTCRVRTKSSWKKCFLDQRLSQALHWTRFQISQLGHFLPD